MTPWYDCHHDGIGLPGCPTCDGRFPSAHDIESARLDVATFGAWSGTRHVALLGEMRGHLRDAYAEIARLRAENERIRARLARVVPVIEALIVPCAACDEPADEREVLHDTIGAALSLGVSPDLYAVALALRALIADEVPRG